MKTPSRSLNILQFQSLLLNKVYRKTTHWTWDKSEENVKLLFEPLNTTDSSGIKRFILLAKLSHIEKIFENLVDQYLILQIIQS